ncbi:hypothetical protein [Mucilaginibacter sp.]
MQEKVELSKLRGFGEIIDDSILFFKQNWKPLFKSYLYICGFFWIASLVIAVLNEINTLQRAELGESMFTFTYFLSLLFEYVSFIITILTVYSYISLYKEKDKEIPTVSEVWNFVKYYFFRVFGSYIVLTLGVIIGTVFCIIPGIYLAIAFSLLIPVIIIENSTLSNAFNRCFQLIKNNWWFTFGIAFVSFIIIMAATMAVGIPIGIVVFTATFLTKANGMHVYLYSSVIISHILQFLYVYPYIAIAFAYFSFAEQKDEGTLLQRIMNIGKTDNSSTPETTEEY